MSILKEADAGAKVKDICRRYGISDATFYNWKGKYGGMSTSELKRLRELEGEVSQYKRMYAELARGELTLTPEQNVERRTAHQMPACKPVRIP